MSFKDNYPLTPPTLSLDFVNSATVDPRVTFSRSSKATYYNPAGLLTVADVNVPRIDYDPITHECKGLLIEEARTNLLTYSEQFDNAAWTKSNSSVLTNLLTYSQEFDNAAWAKTNATVTANAIVAPDGTLTAEKLVENTVNAQHLTQQIMLPNAGTKYTLSFYVKAAERSYCLVGFSGGGLGADCLLGINLTTGVSSSASGAPESTDIVSIGSNWYRVSITKTLPSASLCGLRVMPSIDGISQSYTGDGTSGIYTWGAQLVQGTNPEQYTVTTSAPAPIQVTSPLGFLGAEKLVEGTTAGFHFASQLYSGIGTYSFSFYAKAAERSQLYIDIFNSIDTQVSVLVNLNTGVSANPSLASCTSVGNGWYRICVFNKSITLAGATRYGIFLSNNAGAGSYTGDGTSGIYLWGAQLEVGAFPTSYIPTITEQVIRTADNASMTGTNFSSWYNQSEGTVATEYDRLSNITASGYPRVYSITDGTLLNEIDALQQTGSGEYFSIYTNGTNQALIPNIVVTAGNSIKTTSSYATNNVNSATNTILGVNDNLATIPSVTRLNFGNRFDGLRPLNGHIKSFKYYPIRLTNAQLQTLTNP